MLKAIGGYLQPVEGEMLLNGTRIGNPGPDRAFVFQEFDQLLPWKTVRDNIVFALTASGKLQKSAAIDRALHFIDKVGLNKFADNFPHTLSDAIMGIRPFSTDCGPSSRIFRDALGPAAR